jgi:transposase InsO family protein
MVNARHVVSLSWVSRKASKTREQARSSLFDYLEVFYNRHRRHSAIHYLSPITNVNNRVLIHQTNSM